MEITRTERVENILRREKVDALLVWNEEGSGQPTTEWLSGFSGTASVALVVHTPSPLRLGTSPLRRGRGEGGHHTSCFLITDGRYTAQAKKEAKGFSVIISSARKPTLKILSEIIRKKKVNRILFDGSATAYSVAEEVKQTLEKTTPAAEDGGTPFPKGDTPLRHITLISRKYVLQELRIVKEKAEIRLLAKAAEIACLAFTKLLPKMHAGMTEKEIAKRLEDLMLEEGAEGIAFPTIVASGKNGALPHARATNKRLKNGELVTIDFGARYKGYVSDMTRTIAIGKISPQLKNMYESVRKAQELGCIKAKAGMTGAELDAVCRNYLTKKGLGRYFTHSTGHGIGMEVHELPHVSPLPPPRLPPAPRLRRAGRHPSSGRRGGRKNDKLPVGAVITCEPGLYVPNVGGVRIEDSLVLTKKGTVNLTEEVTKRLIVI